MKAIDFRVRPPYDSFKGLFDLDKWPGALPLAMKNAFGVDDPLPSSYKNNSIEEYLEECDKVDIVASVIACRNGANNDAFVELTEHYPGKFYFFPYVNMADVEQTKEIVEKYIINGNKYTKGVTVEPGVPINGKTYQVNEECFFPVYKYLEENDIPMMLTLAIMTVPFLDNNIPLYVEQILDRFPNLKIIIGHGGAFWGREFGSMCIRRPNLYLACDSQLLCGCGSYDYREARKWTPGNFLFASSYPVTPPMQIKEAYEHSDIMPKDQLEDFFYNNAAKLLGLEEE